MIMNKFLSKVVIGLVLLGLVNLPAYASTLEEELQKLRDAGIPTTLKELAPPEIPDSENAALVYQKVFDLMEKNKDDIETLKSMYYSRPTEHTSRYSNIPEWSKWSDEQKKLFPSLIEKNREIFSLLKKATSMPKCRFPIEYKKGPAISVPHLSKLRNCAYLLAIKATIEVKRGKTEDALNICLIGLKLAKSLSNEPSFLSQLVRIGSIEEKIILPSLEGILNKGGASTGLYRKMLREILEERKCNVTSLGLKGEACGIIVLFEEFRKNLDAGVSMIFIPYKEKEKLRLDKIVRKYRPFAEDDEIFCIRTISEMISLSKQPYWQIRDKLRRIQANIEYRLPEEKNLITKLSLKSCFLFYAYEARSDAILGAAEIGIANRIYKQKYGRYVDSLNQLVPDILSSLPLDPFTGKDFIYRREGKGFILYSVGENLKDDGGLSPQRKERAIKNIYKDIVWCCKR